MTFARSKIVGDNLQMPRCLLRKNVVQDRVHFQRRLGFLRLVAHGLGNRQDGRIRVTVGESVSAGDEQTDIGLGLCSDLELFDQFWNRVSGLLHKIDHRRRTHQRSIDQSIEQILNRPAVFAHAFRTDHPAAAFECVE